MKITIIGAAGTLGSCAAFNIAIHSLADEIVMIDPRQNELRQHVTDLSASLTGQNIIVRTGNDEDMSGSDIVIVTAGAPQEGISSRMELLPHNLPIIRDIARKIKQFCPETVVITATVPVDPPFNIVLVELN
ncbi:L-lactate dehydrogenase, partial [Chloroflexota bacterium]